MKEEIREHLQKDIIPFWKALRDDTFGGYYGFMDFDGTLDKEAVKGCILNSRITWFFSNAYLALGEEGLLEEAKHGFEFLKNFCLDQTYGGVYWSVDHRGIPVDTTKHTYNQAFSIYALSSYYDASKDAESLQIAEELYRVVEEKCRDEEGYLEAFDRRFCPAENDKLSENGVMADRTMNTLLHVFEAYTEFYRVTGKEEVAQKLRWMLDIVADKIYDPVLKRQEVFFDTEYHSLLDLHSYGHDIEAAWLMDRGLAILKDAKYEAKLRPIIEALTEQVYRTAFSGHYLYNECEKGIVDKNCIWWVQAEAMVGFVNGWQKDRSKTEYLRAAEAIWEYIKEYVMDKRNGSEWFWLLNAEGRPCEDKPIVDPWKCPYHNGRMCIEMIRRDIDAA